MAATNVQAFSGDVEVASNLAVDTNVLFVDSVNNRVGIGVTDPSNRLHVVGTDNQLVRIQNTTETARMALNGASGTGGDLIFQEDGTPTWGIATIGDNLHFLGDDSTSQYRMTLDNSGNVGIGTSSPQTKLHVQGPVYKNWEASGEGFVIWNSASYKMGLKQANRELVIFTKTLNGDGDIQFSPNDSQKMVIKESGNVGINTTSPASGLHVRNPGGADVASSIIIQPASTQYARGYTKIEAYLDATVGAGTGLKFYTREDSGGNFDPTSLVYTRMTIRNNGWVGIGEAIPVVRFHVNYTLVRRGNANTGYGGSPLTYTFPSNGMYLLTFCYIGFYDANITQTYMFNKTSFNPPYYSTLAGSTGYIQIGTQQNSVTFTAVNLVSNYNDFGIYVHFLGGANY